MTDHMIDRGDVTIRARTDGVEHAQAPTLVFANSLGTDLTIWDGVLRHLPGGLRIVRFDNRGHGRSSVPPAPYSMGALIGDAEAVCDALDVRDAVFVGLSIGGQIAQGLAVKRLDIIRAMVLSNTAARIGTKELWDSRIADIRAGGLASIADSVMERWFSRNFRASGADAPWRELLLATPEEGYIGCCAAISGSDFFTPTSGLRLPTLAIAGSEDASTPPDLVRETAELIPGSRFELMRRVGHLPGIEAPEAYAALLVSFLRETGHLTEPD
ncbi:3-oxoadipate enol-lactonase [Roseisalinus antarcticus]|uniref:3-oxoadipate enol-lactonase 2 n=1 Tax=Roseisalinus antarcticus TaxID=254357 RepID=A0A1Y5SVV8_9RHOB|nr:3-oxoadipate enol-lactonase [Roseisalinus antarcticus]SLN49631.1 3-oxoadipate enol-lactonase 2 [Roseisalinus antarcticus]